MKHERLMKLLAGGTAGVLAVSTVFAQTSSTVTTTNDGRGVATTTTRTTDLDATGVVSAYTPGQDYVTFRSERDTAPVRYYYTKSTTVVDPDGRTVEWSALRPDMPVRYTYVNEGGRMVVSKVTVLKPVNVIEKETTTTSATSGKEFLLAAYHTAVRRSSS
jgi:hypothetical protein